jgi:hypothetical protein
MSSHEHDHHGCSCSEHAPAGTGSANPAGASPSPAPAVDVETAIARAFALLHIGAKGGGISMAAGGGEIKLMKPIMIGLEFAEMLKRAKYERPAEPRPTFDLRILVEEENGDFECTVHQVVGVAAHESMEDPSKVLFSFKTQSLEDASSQLCQQLKSIIGDTKLTVTQLFYRNTAFAEHSFERGDKPAKPLSYSKRLSGNADQELSHLVTDATLKALAWGAGKAKAKYVSLWFCPDGSQKPVYANIYSKGDSYEIVVHDQVQLPPKKNVLDKVCSSAEDVADALARYMSRQHARKFKTLAVSFFYEQDLQAS